MLDQKLIRTSVNSISRRHFLLLLEAAGVSACAAAPASSFAGRVQQDHLRDDLHAWIDRIVEDSWVSGASIQILGKAHAPITVMGGLADRERGTFIGMDTIYRIYSMTKPVTTTAVMILVEAGLVDLDQPIADFLPEFSAPRVFVRVEEDKVVTEASERSITVRHLLTHTSGLSHSFNKEIEPTGLLYEKAGLSAGQWDPALGIDTLEKFVKAIANIPLAAQPGTRWNYGTSLDVAGRVVEVASGTDFGEFVQARIVAPLGMEDTSFELPDSKRDRLAALYIRAPDGKLARLPDGLIPAWGDEHVVPTGGTGLFSTLPDYSRFVSMLMNGGKLDGIRVLSSASVEAMMKDQLGPEFGAEPLSSAARFGLGGEVGGLGFGLGGSVMRDPAQANGIGSAGEYSWGGAASTAFWIDRARGLAVILMTQKLPSGSLPLRDQLRRIVYNNI